MTLARRHLVAFSVILSAGWLGGCGHASVVAIVGGQQIALSSYQHWVRIDERSLASDPNVQQRSQLARVEAMEFLIRARWVSGEAHARDMNVSQASLDSELARTEATAGGKARYVRSLEQAGMTTQDVLSRLWINELTQRLQAAESRAPEPVTDQQIATYYRQHSSEFHVPQRRGFAVIYTKNPHTAQTARRALESGLSFAAAARRYSIGFTRNRGDTPIVLPRRELDARLGNPVFTAPIGRIEGPVHAQLGYYIFKVEEVLPPGPMPAATRRQLIVQVLDSQLRNQAAAGVLGRLAHRWTRRTHCNPGFVVSGCREYRSPRS
jgi:parvulin-like peptidyl-prolyl isomerase